MNKKRIAGAVVVVIAAVGLLLAWQIGLFSSEPPEANLADAIAAASESDDSSDSGPSDDSDDAEDSDTSEDSDPAAAGSTDPAAPGEDDENVGAELDTADLPCIVANTEAPASDAEEISEPGDLIGIWAVRSSGGTFAGYRIDEILSGIDFEAVGRSSNVSGTVQIDDGGDGQFTVSEVSIAVDMTSLESDSDIRDGQLKTQALETNDFPVACFELTEPVTLAGVPVQPEQFPITVTGDLTIHGVTRSEQIELEATTANGLIFVVGSIDVPLVDFDIDTPEARIVAGVGEVAVMEFSLVLGR